MNTLANITAALPTQSAANRPTSAAPTATAPTTGNAAQDPKLIPTATLFDAVGVVLDLSLENRDVVGAYSQLSSSDKSAFLNQLSELMQQGVVGTETLEVRGEAYTTDITTRLGDETLRHAPQYRRLDVLA